MISANTLDLEGHMGELEMMHEVLEGEIDAIVRPTVLFSHTDELEIPELAEADTKPPENLQGNSTTIPLGTQPLSPQSPLEDTLVSLDEPLPCPWVKAGDADLQARTEELLDVRLLGYDTCSMGSTRIG